LKPPTRTHRFFSWAGFESNHIEKIRMNKDDFGMLEVYQTSCFWGSSAVVTRLGLNTHTHNSGNTTNNGSETSNSLISKTLVGFQSIVGFLPTKTARFCFPDAERFKNVSKSS